MRIVRRKESLFAVVLLLAAARAQDRQALLGEVVDAAGAPVARATVTLVEDDPDLVGVDPVDVITTTSDARGRFAAMAFAGVRYTALAVGPEADGRAAVAPPVPDLACGRAAKVQLTLTGQRRTATLPGLAAWGKPADLRVHIVFDRCPGHALAVPLRDDGSVDLPPALAAGALELRDAAGAWLGRFLVPIAPDQAIEAPPRRTLDVIVLDHAHNAVADARVRVQHHTSVYTLPFGVTTPRLDEGPVVRTDVEGRASVPYSGWDDPFERAPDHLVVLVDKEGFAESASGWVHQMSFYGNTVTPKLIPRTILVPLRPLEAVRGRAAGAGRATLLAHTVVAHERNGATFRYLLPRRREVECAADGTFALPWLAAGAGDVQLVVPRHDGRRVVLPSVSDGAPPLFARDACEPLTLRLTTATGTPAVGADVLIVPHRCTLNDLAHAAPLIADERGEIPLLLPRGAWTVLAMHGSQWALHDLTTWTAAAPVELALGAKAAVRVRVVDRAGAPVAGVRFEPGTFRPGPYPDAGAEALVGRLGYNFFGAHVRQAATDTKGEATLHVVPWPRTTPTVFAFLTRHDRRSADFAATPGDGVTVVTMPW